MSTIPQTAECGRCGTEFEIIGEQRAAYLRGRNVYCPDHRGGNGT